MVIGDQSSGKHHMIATIVVTGGMIDHCGKTFCIVLQNLCRGMVIAIEPMVNAGAPDVKECRDGWTVVTRDGSLAAHYEHTVALTENGIELLTKVN